MRKFYMIRISLLIMVFSIITVAMVAQNGPISSKKIIFVGGVDEVDLATSEPGDKNLIDSISKWVYVDYMPSDTFNTTEAAVLYDGIAGVIISESIGSNAVPNFGPARDNFPVPSIVMEMSCFVTNTDRWGIGNTEGYDPAVAADLQWKIIDNFNYITEPYAMNEILDYATGSPDRGIAYLHTMNDPVIRLAEPNKTLTNADGFAIGIINQKILFMAIAKIYPEPARATQKLFDVLRRGIEYMFDAYPTTLDKVIKDRNNLSFYPNPARDYLNVMFPSNAGKDAEISVISLAGQEIAVKSFTTISGVNHVKVNLDGISQGMYFIRLKINNEITVEKVLVE